MRAHKDVLKRNIVPWTLYASFQRIKGRTLCPLYQCQGVNACKVRTVGFLNSLTRSFPWELVGRKRYARFGPFSLIIASFNCTTKVAKSIVQCQFWVFVVCHSYYCVTNHQNIKDVKFTYHDARQFHLQHDFWAIDEGSSRILHFFYLMNGFCISYYCWNKRSQMRPKYIRTFLHDQLIRSAKARPVSEVYSNLSYLIKIASHSWVTTGLLSFREK